MIFIEFAFSKLEKLKNRLWRHYPNFQSKYSTLRQSPPQQPMG